MNSSSGSMRCGASARNSSSSRERGFALVAVISIIGILAVIAMALTERARVGTSTAAALLDETRDLFAVQAAIAKAERALAEHPDLGKESQLRLDLVWDKRHLDTVITDKAGKIDVNRASSHQLAEGFKALGLDAGDAATLAARTIDWRDPDGHPEPNGAEADEYLAAGFLSPPRNDRFVSLDELETVLGMPRDVPLTLQEGFTVTRPILPTAPFRANALSTPGLSQQMSGTAASDGLTRSADVSAGARAFDVEVRLRRDGSEAERDYLSVRQQ